MKNCNKNEIIFGDILEVLSTFSDESIDLVITSPPYFNLRSYSYWETYNDSAQTWVRSAQIPKDFKIDD